MDKFIDLIMKSPQAYIAGWVVGLLGCWVVGLLGCWVVGLLGCFDRNSHGEVDRIIVQTC